MSFGASKITKRWSKRRRFGKKSILGLCLQLYAAGCTAQPHPIYTDPQQPIRLSAQTATFTLQLPSNPTTGYRWQLLAYRTDLLKLIQHTYLPPAKAMPGRGGIEQWQFSAMPVAFKQPQTFSIKLIYARPWENNPNVQPVVFKLSTQ